MTADHRQHYLEGVRTGLSAAVYPLYYVVNLPIVAGGWIGSNFTTHQTLKTENDRLRSEHLLLQAQVQKLAALEAENHRLRTLLEASSNVNEHVSVADIVAVDIDPYARKLVLNKGRREGVYEGQPLIDGAGIMGQIIEVGEPSSVAMLITDTGHSLPVMLNRTGLRAIAVGMGASGEIDLPHLPNSTDIKKGDVLVTSGLDGRFPPNYPAAIVTDVEKKSGQPFMRVRATPAARLEHNREVLLVWRAPPAPCMDAQMPPEGRSSASCARGTCPSVDGEGCEKGPLKNTLPEATAVPGKTPAPPALSPPIGTPLTTNPSAPATPPAKPASAATR
jgi:rod shape-determining protein MreC